MAQQTKNTLINYNNCPELATKWLNILDSVHLKEDGVTISNIVETATEVTFTFSDASEVVIPLGGGVSEPLESFTLIGTSIGKVQDGEIMPAHANSNERWKYTGIKEIPKTFTNPTASISSTKPSSELHEIGEDVAMNITTSFNAQDSDGLIGVAELPEIPLEIFKDNVQIGTVTPLNALVVTITSAYQRIKATYKYLAGTATKTSLAGTEYPNTVAAGSVTTLEKTYKGIIPYFYGKSVALPVANQALIDGGTKAINGDYLKATNGTITINHNAVGEFVWVAIPLSATQKSTYFKSVLDTGAISLLFNESTVVVNSPLARWNNESYVFLISKVAGTHNTNLELRN